MESEIIFMIEESPEGGYEARCLGHSIFTKSDTLDGLRSGIKDAVACHFEDTERPKIIRLHFVREIEMLTSEDDRDRNLADRELASGEALDLTQAISSW